MPEFGARQEFGPRQRLERLRAPPPPPPDPSTARYLQALQNEHLGLSVPAVRNPHLGYERAVQNGFRAAVRNEWLDVVDFFLTDPRYHLFEHRKECSYAHPLLVARDPLLVASARNYVGYQDEEEEDEEDTVPAVRYNMFSFALIFKPPA